ncbi:hypothetical protein C1645_841192 [Glomus cerebriforme]|uniref:PARP catalytic domain-containing protein n=1 Tax=Glomus cerebriforme TaxID=658196 RepID=A0A397SA84_9GLOM|nr:hypothetical protein C1645_841192 [Glomus cerebriforme]
MTKCLYCSECEPDLDPNGSLSEYCSDECRRKALATGFTTPCIRCDEFPRLLSSQYCGWERCRNAKRCIKCKKKYVTILNSLWCSKQCRDITPNWRSMVKSNELCLKCTKENTYFGKYFCGIECEEWVKENGPCIFKLSKRGNKFKDILNQFISSWKHRNKAVPEIHTIYKIFPDKQIISRYNEYQDYIENLRRLEGRPFPKGDGGRTMTKGNEQRRFHGTRMKCLLGIKTDTLCSNVACAVCRIITEGYKLIYAKTSRFKYQKFGDGIYFSSTSSKSDDFNRDSLKHYNGAKYKVMFLNKVIVGRAFELSQENRTLTGPPINYDSVVGEPGGLLYYDELVVYKEPACIPQYLIVYEIK